MFSSLSENKTMSSYQKQNWDYIVLGLGKTGWSISQFLHKQKKTFAVMDSREHPPKLDDFRKKFPEHPLFLGKFDNKIIENANTIVVSPGIDANDPVCRKAQSKGIQVLGDIEIFFQYATAPVVAITGTNGKSTVTSLVGAIAQEHFSSVGIGGNLGIPALDLILSPEHEVYILELSSFQLEYLDLVGAKIATILNISEDHLDRHKTLENYLLAKSRIFTGADTLVVNMDDEIVLEISARYPRKKITFSLSKHSADVYLYQDRSGELFFKLDECNQFPVSSFQLHGMHNYANALAAIAIARALSIPISAIETGLKKFVGLEHRCVRIGTWEKVTWYNDSKATNVGATIAAVQGLLSHSHSTGKVVLLAGGIGKCADFSLLKSIIPYLRAVVLFGQDAKQIETVFKKHIPIKIVENIEQVVSTAAQIAFADDVVLFAPACASFDMFDNYQNRGSAFVSAVLNHMNQENKEEQ